MTARVLDRRSRNRALLARQLLLERGATTPLRVVERLVGLQAQTPRSPYTALWSRLRDFDPMSLSGLLESRRAVRVALMRSTIHLVSARDAMILRPLIVPVLLRELGSRTYRGPLAGLDLDALAATARQILDARPMTPAALGAALAETWRDREPRALAHAARTMLPLVQIPPRGLWDRAGATRLATAQQWLEREPDPDPSWDDVVVRYLGAFGPASAADAVVWSRITGLGEVFARLRPRLRVLHDTDGRELFDVPRAPRPPASTPAPPRFLPDYDNLLLSHSDRNHVFADAHRSALQSTNGVLPGTLLVDGFVAAAWHLERGPQLTRLLIRALDAIPARAVAAIREEGAGLLQFLAPAAERTEVVLR